MTEETIAIILLAFFFLYMSEDFSETGDEFPCTIAWCLALGFAIVACVRIF